MGVQLRGQTPTKMLVIWEQGKPPLAGRSQMSLPAGGRERGQDLGKREGVGWVRAWRGWDRGGSVW